MQCVVKYVLVNNIVVVKLTTPFKHANSAVEALTNDCILAAVNHDYDDNQGILEKQKTKWTEIYQSQPKDVHL